MYTVDRVDYAEESVMPRSGMKGVTVTSSYINMNVTPLLLTCCCSFLNSLVVVFLGTNWRACSILTGVLLCCGDPSVTHWTSKNMSWHIPTLSNNFHTLLRPHQLLFFSLIKLSTITFICSLTIPTHYIALLGHFHRQPTPTFFVSLFHNTDYIQENADKIKNMIQFIYF